MDATGDLVLRPPEPSDAEPLHLLFRDLEVTCQIGDGRVRDLAYYEDFAHHQRELFHTKGYCLHTLCVEGRVAGFAGLHDWSAEWGPTESAELGYRLGERYQGRGIAFDAARRVFSGVPHLPLTAVIAAGNTRPKHLVLRPGFVAAESYWIPGGGEARCHRRGAGTGPRKSSGPGSIRPGAMAGAGFEPTWATSTVLQTTPFGRSGNLPNVG